MGNIVPFDKLVRDNIPERNKANGETAVVRLCSNDEEFEMYVDKKILEEANEVGIAKTKEELVQELADLREICLTKADLHGITEVDIESARKQRAKERGRFKTRTILLQVEDPTKAA